jgi:peptide chain release factor subunit 1
MEDAKRKLKKLIKELEKVRGRHTELVTIYVPFGYDLNYIRTQVSQERGTAQNIKSKSTRKNVMAALDKITQELKFYKKVPPNGLAIFSGNTSDQEGEQRIGIWMVEPPEKLNVKMYRCEQEFLLDPLREMLEAKRKYALVVVDNKNITLGMLKGKSIVMMKSDDSLVPGKIRAGGQSAVRFSRVRENMAKEWYKINAKAVEELFGDKSIDGIILGGPGPTKETFMEFLSKKIKDKIIAVKDIGYTGEFGLRELVNKSLDVLKEEEIAQEKEYLNHFFSRMGKGERVSYGKENVKNSLVSGAVETLLLSEDGDEEMEELASKMSTKIVFISKETMEGEQFHEMGGYGALLRYDT